MYLYLDIDGVLLDYNTDTYAKGDAAPAIEYLSGYFTQEIIEKLKKIKPTYREDLKTEGINFDSNFIWLDDYPFPQT